MNKWMCKECKSTKLEQEAICNINTDEIIEYLDSSPICCHSCGNETVAVEIDRTYTGGKIMIELEYDYMPLRMSKEELIESLENVELPKNYVEDSFRIVELKEDCNK